MERLTKRDKYGAAYAKGDNTSLSVGTEHDPSIVRGDIVDRLAAYEDTGLEPEETKNLKFGVIPEHWSEQFKAECEDRLVVLPCRVGDVVYVPWHGQTYREIVRDIVLTPDKNDYMVWLNGYPHGVLYGEEEFSKCAYLTRKEAEEALEKEAIK